MLRRPRCRATRAPRRASYRHSAAQKMVAHSCCKADLFQCTTAESYVLVHQRVTLKVRYVLTGDEINSPGGAMKCKASGAVHDPHI